MRPDCVCFMVQRDTKQSIERNQLSECELFEEQRVPKIAQRCAPIGSSSLFTPFHAWRAEREIGAVGKTPRWPSGVGLALGSASFFEPASAPIVCLEVV
ncbi:hypothetical protein AVEN_86808-1 [Araneus ventricosus]|uniref:Uncharacterized protein n=1 Tax=Araneus ventricosus TaxID=182803 RepID=A0A4Y2CZK3_ARAVE|nr:hypothetical protein AVEN_86808-1 [Araneus ventricosus]